jgi:fatty acid amide hydrolase
MPLGDRHAIDVTKLRIGYYETLGSFAPAPAVARAVREAAAIFGDLGARVTPFKPPHPDDASDIFYGILGGDGFASAVEFLGENERDFRIANLATIGTKPRALLGPLQRVLEFAGQDGLASMVSNLGHSGAQHYWKMVEAQNAYRRIFEHELDTAEGGPFDVLLGPACGLPAIPHGESYRLSTAGAYASLYNVLGYPTGIVPFTKVRVGEEVGRRRSLDLVELAAYRSERESAGLPVGVQVIARPWQEHVALAAMKALETVARSRSEYPVTPVVSI